jgi:PhzF family phenazine biosynthesis protein
MAYNIYQVDAFTDKLFSGNPASVCPLEKWIKDELLQKIAMENNQAETAFYVKKGNEYEIRWFTPVCEVDLCGHATLASAHVLFHHRNHKESTIVFQTVNSGKLTVSRNRDLLTLNFPSDKIEAIALTEELTACFDLRPAQAFRGKTDFMLIYENEKQIKNIIPDFQKISKLDARGIIITAKGNTVDFVSRFFGPQSGIDEDPVTGSAHTSLVPYWSAKTGKKEMNAVQLSGRKGFLKCKNLGSRVEISGNAKTYMVGEIFPDENA